MIYLLTVFRSLVGHLLILPWTIFVSLTVIVLGAFKYHDAVTFWMALWSKAVLWFYGVEVKRDGLDKLPRSGGAVLIFNHQSHFDIPAVTAFSGRRLRYGAKIELFKIPFFGPAIRAAGCLPIARENRSEVLRIYEEASEKFREGVIFALAPEGTRQNGPVIGAFKKGPFIFATRSQVPVVEQLNQTEPSTKVILISGHADKNIAIRALRLGVFDLIEKPWKQEMLCESVIRALVKAYRQRISEIEFEKKMARYAGAMPPDRYEQLRNAMRAIMLNQADSEKKS